MAEITITVDNSDKVLRSLEQQIEAALEACGQQAVSHAKQNITRKVPRNSGSWYVPTGALRNSLNHEVNGKVCYVGTNMDYAIYNEVGTGIYAEHGIGRKTPWTYVDDRGVGHRTRGISAIHFLRDSLQDHVDEYKHIIENELSK